MGRSFNARLAMGVGGGGLLGAVLFSIFQNKVPYVVLLAISLLLGVSIGGLIGLIESKARRRRP